MKTNLFLKMLVLFSFLVLMLGSIYASNKNEMSELNYVSIEGKSYFSNDVKIGSSNVRITTDEGLLLKASLKKVDAFMVDGKFYERLPLMCDGKYKGTKLMEFVKHKNGLRLYKCHFDNQTNKLCCFYENNEPVMYFVYKDGEFHLMVDEKNAATVFDFFKIKFEV